jgi:hypothetical protein
MIETQQRHMGSNNHKGFHDERLLELGEVLSRDGWKAMQ